MHCPVCCSVTCATLSPTCTAHCHMCNIVTLTHIDNAHIYTALSCPVQHTSGVLHEVQHCHTFLNTHLNCPLPCATHSVTCTAHCHNVTHWHCIATTCVTCGTCDTTCDTSVTHLHSAVLSHVSHICAAAVLRAVQHCHTFLNTCQHWI